MASDQRAIQYFGYPEWKFDRLREEYPDGRYEVGANIGPDAWSDIDDSRVQVTVTDTEALTVTETKVAPVVGDIGLFIDIGSECFFSDLKISLS
ncbi:MAG TPA: hypothetical protein VE462_01860 [Propionibacteriaceae bacterium]|nr:hypothetical protein [Propionibacteriaceae bacterium]